MQEVKLGVELRPGGKIALTEGAADSWMAKSCCYGHPNRSEDDSSAVAKNSEVSSEFARWKSPGCVAPDAVQAVGTLVGVERKL